MAAVGGLTTDDKVKLAGQFLVDSPPGEFHEVLNDIRSLIKDDVKLHNGIKKAALKHNVDQFIITRLPSGSASPRSPSPVGKSSLMERSGSSLSSPAKALNGSEVIVSQYGQLDENTFFDPRTKQKFKFDHFKYTASCVEPHIPESSGENDQILLRDLVDQAVDNYVKDHYQQGVSAVFLQDGLLHILVASNKYSPNNFWNGRWRSEWTYKISGGTLTGLLRTTVHYYEDGNIQLTTEKKLDSTINSSNDKAAIVEQLIKQISATDSEYQHALNESYADLSETTFKGLRRALPVTKTKIDWDKILNYKLASAIHQQH